MSLHPLAARGRSGGNFGSGDRNLRPVQTCAVSSQRYVDGAASDNLPRCWTNNTVTISAYAGESDLCPPRGSSIGFHQVRFNNVSIQVNAENLSRVASTFFPPEPQVSRASPPPPAARWSYCRPVSLTGSRRTDGLPGLTGAGGHLPRRLRGRAALPAGQQ